MCVWGGGVGLTWSKSQMNFLTDSLYESQHVLIKKLSASALIPMGGGFRLVKITKKRTHCWRVAKMTRGFHTQVKATSLSDVFYCLNSAGQFSMDCVKCATHFQLTLIRAPPYWGSTTVPGTERKREDNISRFVSQKLNLTNSENTLDTDKCW